MGTSWRGLEWQFCALERNQATADGLRAHADSIALLPPSRHHDHHQKDARSLCNKLVCSVQFERRPIDRTARPERALAPDGVAHSRAHRTLGELIISMLASLIWHSRKLFALLRSLRPTGQALFNLDSRALLCVGQLVSMETTPNQLSGPATGRRNGRFAPHSVAGRTGRWPGASCAIELSMVFWPCQEAAQTAAARFHMKPARAVGGLAGRLFS